MIRLKDLLFEAIVDEMASTAREDALTTNAKDV